MISNVHALGGRMTQITIRNIESQLHQALKREADKKNTSMNRLVVYILKEAMGLEGKVSHKKYHDLDHLMGTWTESEFDEFEAATEDFDHIDGELWE